MIAFMITVNILIMVLQVAGTVWMVRNDLANLAVLMWVLTAPFWLVAWAVPLGAPG